MASYSSPLGSRYASRAMSRLFGDDNKYSTWRRLWLHLARAQRKLGLPIPAEAVAELKANLFSIDYAAVARHEQALRHDVMAHIHALKEVCPAAAPVIHLGATSCYVTDNADLMVYRDALDLLAKGLCSLITKMCLFAQQHRDLPCLGATHFQPAQPTTVGKRCTLWIHDFVCDLKAVVRVRNALQFRGVKGTTGTQASFLALFGGDHAKVDSLDRAVTKLASFRRRLAVCGQTYPRKVDFDLLSVLASLGVSVHRVATDIRLLSGLGELEEPSESSQIGSSAMAYKRNPMRCERACSLARYLFNLPANAAHTASTQWLERTLDDSANRRIVMPEAFLAADAVVNIMDNVFGGLLVFPKVCNARLMAELPFMATENILMAMVTRGADRQECHEQLRVLSLQSRALSKNEGVPNDLLERIALCPYFAPIHSILSTLLNPEDFVGRAPQQVDAFLARIDKFMLKFKHLSEHHCEQLVV